MEESADWRLRYDEAVERASKCTKELIEIKKSLKKVEDAAGINKKLEMLQKTIHFNLYISTNYMVAGLKQSESEGFSFFRSWRCLVIVSTNMLLLFSGLIAADLELLLPLAAAAEALPLFIPEGGAI
ncbi:uncharacterized protein LOC130760495 isoform X1 [Actinidia eriantha]|uniref:uncharacterized protein LOC130760495 isoform X1 n=1 Tax=Actinidia eriantha TaxID=165200 RepID=UPI002585A6D7|nr:uncharacterized protein LOC130760495 isoform X1 [Actinidia eriantha]